MFFAEEVHTLDLSVGQWVLLKKVLPRKLSRHHLKKMMSSPGPGQEEVNHVEEDQEEDDPLVKRRKVEVSVSSF